MKSVLIDDFADPINDRHVPDRLRPHKELGVISISRDVIADGLPDIGPIDILTSFDSLEHWHHSPKRLLRQAMSMMRPGGRIVIGVPNCVNARKRITMLLGRNKWSSMAEWYDSEVFRGHVREPDVGDLVYIAKDMGISNYQIVGRNWQGRHSSNPVVRNISRLSDGVLRLRPSLCSDIYLLGQL
jgi:SAM-dependent methyltransferase